MKSTRASRKTPKAPVPKRGAPSKRTPQRREAILRAIQLGASYKAAANSAGIGLTTFDEWRNDDPEFAEAVDKARAQMEVAMLERIEQAATDPKTWQAAAWKLERLVPDRYGPRRAPVEVTGVGGAPIAVEGSIDAKLDALSIAALEKLASEE